MKKYLIGLLMALSLSAYADYSFTPGNGDVVILHEGVACTGPAKDFADKRGVVVDVPLFAAEATVGGKHFNACWGELGNFVGLIYEDGDQGLVPVELFKKLKET